MGKKILVVEDDPQIGRMLQLMLQNMGYAVELQVDGHVVSEMRYLVKDAGADHFLAKPFEMEELLALVVYYLGNE